MTTAGGADDGLMDLAASIACHQALAVDAAIAAIPGVGPRIKFYQQDWIPGFAAFIDDGKKLTRDPKSTAFCVLNLGSFLAAIQTGDLSHEDLAREIADSMCHEVLHVIEKWCGIEFSEDRVNGLLEKYRDAALADSDDPTHAETASVAQPTPSSAPEETPTRDLIEDPHPAFTAAMMADLTARPRPGLRQEPVGHQTAGLATPVAFAPENAASAPSHATHDAMAAGLRCYIVMDEPTRDALMLAASMAFAGVWDQAVALMAEAGPMPLAGTEAWVEGGEAYWTRLRKHPDFVWAMDNDGSLDGAGEAQEITRARLVLATTNREG